MYWCVCMHDKTKIPDGNDLKRGTLIVVDAMLKLIDFGFKRSKVRDIGSSFHFFLEPAAKDTSTDYYLYEDNVDSIKLQ